MEAFTKEDRYSVARYFSLVGLLLVLLVVNACGLSTLHVKGEADIHTEDDVINTTKTEEDEK